MTPDAIVDGNGISVIARSVATWQSSAVHHPGLLHSVRNDGDTVAVGYGIHRYCDCAAGSNPDMSFSACLVEKCRVSQRRRPVTS
jgi:hypothetical protein